MKKIIFLDFDGVLQIEKYDNPWMGNAQLKAGYLDRDHHGLLFDFDCVNRLSQLVELTEAKIVISSSWRFVGVEKMQEMWHERKLPGEVIDITPIEEDYSNVGLGTPSRGECIQYWLDENPVDKYVIIDDSDDMLSQQLPSFVQTEYDKGFQPEDLKNAIGILTNKT